MNIDKLHQFKVELSGYDGDVVHIPEAYVAENYDYFTATTSVVASEAFGDPTMDQAYMAEMLAGNDLSLAISKEGEIVGLLMSRVREYGEERVLGYARANLKKAQGKGLSTKMLQEVISYHHPTAFSSRSQNPAALYSSTKMWRARGVQTIYPFDRYYIEDPRAIDLLQKHIVARTEKPIDIKTGRVSGFYDKRLGDYQVDKSHTGIASIENWLISHDFDREAGDSLVYMGFLK